MNMMRKGQVLGISKGAIKERILFINQICRSSCIIQTPATEVFCPHKVFATQPSLLYPVEINGDALRPCTADLRQLGVCLNSKCLLASPRLMCNNSSLRISSDPKDRKLSSSPR